MSDIYFNCLTVRGATREVADFKERNQGTATDAQGRSVKCPFSFGALVPYPIDLNVPYGGYAESLYHVLYSGDEEMLSDSGVQHAGLKDRRALAAYFKKEDPDAARLAAQYRRNIKKIWSRHVLHLVPGQVGSRTMIWATAKSGTCGSSKPVRKNSFTTSRQNWGVPDGWLMTVANLFPKIEFKLTWEGADSETTGVIRYRNGKQVQFVNRDMWLLDDDKPDGEKGSYIRYPEGPSPAPKVKKDTPDPKGATQETQDESEVAVKEGRCALARQQNPGARPRPEARQVPAHKKGNRQ